MEIKTRSIRSLAYRCEEFLDESGQPRSISYPNSLALCILDALFMTGSHPTAIDNVVDRYTARHGGADGAKSLRYSIAAAGGSEKWAREVICNLKPAHTQPGAMLRAEVVDRATRVMADHGIDTVDDLLAAVGDEPSSGHGANEVARRWRDLPSQSSGTSWRNLLVLAESTHFEIDRGVVNYVAEVAPHFGEVDSEYALGTIAAAADLLGVDDRVVNRIVWQASHRRILSKRTQEDLFLHRYAAEWSEVSDAEFVAGSAGVFDDEDESEALEREREAEFHLGSVRSLPELMPVPQPVPDERGPAPF